MITIEKTFDAIFGVLVTGCVGFVGRLIYNKIKRIDAINKPLEKIYLDTDEEKYLEEISKENLEKINKIFQAQVKITGPYLNEPTIISNGYFDEINDEIKIKVKDYEKIFSERNTPNDLHAIIANKINHQDDPISLETEITDYAMVRAIREGKPSHLWPKILSGSALVFDKKTGHLILHRRSNKSATYKEHLHTIGGAFWPRTATRDGDKNSIRNTVQREVYEEINTNIEIKKDTPLFLIEEINTGFIQFLYVGCNVIDSDRLEGNAEGTYTKRSFQKIEELLSGDEKIVPSGEAAIFLWLAMGANGLGKESNFRGKKSKEIFEKVVQKRLASAQKPDVPVMEIA